MTSADQRVSDWLGAELDFETNLYNGRSAAVVEVMSGSVQPWLVLTAPHAVNHWRNGSVKAADRGTGGLVRVLAGRLGCLGLATASQAYSDAAVDDQHELKEELVRAMATVRVLIDVHGMSDQRDLDAEIGLGLTPSAASRGLGTTIARSLAEAELRVAFNERYVSPNPRSVTNWGLARGIPSVQVEIAARARPPHGSDRNCAALVRALEDALSVPTAEMLWPIER